MTLDFPMGLILSLMAIAFFVLRATKPRPDRFTNHAAAHRFALQRRAAALRAASGMLR